MHLDINGMRLMGRRFGVGRYIEYLLKQWATLDWPFASATLHTPSSIREPWQLPPFIEHRITASFLSDALWEQVVLPRQRRPGGLLFCPGYVAPLATKGKIVVTHHGSYEAIPSAFAWRQRMTSRALYQVSACRADVVITVSASSKADILRFYRTSAGKVVVIPQGVDDRFRPIHDTKTLRDVRYRFFGDGRPFILFVGKLTRRRNVPNLIEALGRLRREHGIQHSLLLVGQNSGGYDLDGLARSAGIADAVFHSEYEEHDTLPALYNAADLFVYPSSYEGFGVPVLEAMACGIPSVAVRGSAFEEFAAGAYLAESGSTEEIARAISAVLFSPEVRRRLAERGLSRASEYRWRPIAERTLNVLAEVGST